MKAGVLFSGGKDSAYSAYIAKRQGHELKCLISVFSENPESYMFHTPSIEKTKRQAELMGIPLITKKTKGKKEDELEDLKEIIKEAISNYGIEMVVTGAIDSVYQASRIQKICNELGIRCFNPLWRKDEIEYLNELLENDFKIIITGVFAYPLDKSFLGKTIDRNFIETVKELNKKYKIHPAGEGGEFETFVIDCPLFKRPVKVKDKKIFSTGKYSHKIEIEVE